MLAHLDKVKGVEKSFANRSGRVFRIQVSEAARVESVAKELQDKLAKLTRSLTRVKGADFKRAINDEEWRDVQRISELTAIEFRTLAIRSVAEFAESEQLNSETADSLVKLAEQEWDRMSKDIAAELRKDRDKRDWRPLYDRFDQAMRDRAKPLLTSGQVDRFVKAVSAKRPEAPNPGKTQTLPSGDNSEQPK